MLTSTNGVILYRAEQNHDCCLTNSISRQEDGKNLRWPMVTDDGKCVGGHEKTFQQWLDETVRHYEMNEYGLCFDGWRYLGMFMKTSKNTYPQSFSSSK